MRLCMLQKPRVSKEDVLARLGSKVRPWFEDNPFPTLADVVATYTAQGFRLDPSGLLMRRPFTEQEEQELRRTNAEWVFLRPSTFYTLDQGETVYVLHGSGQFFHTREDQIVTEKPVLPLNSTELRPGTWLYVDPNMPHGFWAQRSNFLHLVVSYDGILEEGKETVIMPFQDFDSYVMNWNKAESKRRREQQKAEKTIKA